MKKILFMTMLFGTAIVTGANAQSTQQAAAQPQAKETAKAQSASAATPAMSADDAAMLQQAKEKQKGPMVEKTGLSEAQVERIIEINFEIRQAARGLRDLNETDRSARITELKALKEKKYAEILTPEQVKTVHTYYEDMGKAMQQKAGN
ncbi:MAG: hypothetical protein EOO16_02340 [Chitinophagaceae bacterium]|nr:MAG: hypothetical protein EOO16_02340 [Chitinophagaceae bacterium]